LLSLVDATTYVFDADGLIMGRLASASADILLKAAREDRDDKVIIVNAEKAIISGRPRAVLDTYHKKYELNHARKGPFFPRMPDMILKRAVRGMLPYQKKSSGRRALRNLRVEIGCPATSPATCPRATSTATTANSAAICLTATSAWVMSVQIWEHPLTDGREVTSDGTKEEVR